MNKIDRSPRPAGYEQDFALWSAEQAVLLRAGRFDSVDLGNIAEEIESLGRSDRREVASRVGVILLHLLEWQYQPGKRKSGWQSTLIEQRDRLAKLLAESPSLVKLPSEALTSEYPAARRKAAAEMRLSVDVVPAMCPFSVEQVLDPDWLPDAG